MSFDHVFNCDLIKKIDEDFSSNLIIKVILKADDRNEMSAEQVTDLSYDLIDLMGFETLEDIILMFKMYRKGQLGNNKFQPMKGFTGREITRILVPEYLSKKAEIRENKRHNFDSSHETESLIYIAENFKDIVFNPEQRIDTVTDAFKTTVGMMTPSEALTWLTINQNSFALERKIDYVKRYLESL